VIIHRTGSIVATAPVPNANAVTVDQRYGTIYVATTDGRVQAFDSSGTAKWQTNFGDHIFTGVDVWGAKTVSAVGSGRAGTEQKIGLHFTGSKGKSYAAAVSFGCSPAIIVPGPRSIHLRADQLFFITLGVNIPGLTHGFVGVLDGNGYAMARFTIPKEMPPGLRVYFSAVALNPSYPGGLDVANSAVFKVW
jgi:hypothetical protein